MKSFRRYRQNTLALEPVAIRKVVSDHSAAARHGCRTPSGRLSQQPARRPIQPGGDRRCRVYRAGRRQGRRGGDAVLLLALCYSNQELPACSFRIAGLKPSGGAEAMSWVRHLERDEQ